VRSARYDDEALAVIDRIDESVVPDPDPIVIATDGKTVTMAYDAAGNLTSASSAALNATKTLAYNAKSSACSHWRVGGCPPTRQSLGANPLRSPACGGLRTRQWNPPVAAQPPPQRGGRHRPRLDASPSP
jgi:YD repeat-containing protein